MVFSNDFERRREAFFKAGKKIYFNKLLQQVIYCNLLGLLNKAAISKERRTLQLQITIIKNR